VFAAVLLLGASWQAVAAETVLLDESAAQRCYLAALRGADASEAEPCTTALEHQGLKTEDFAATLSNRALLLARSGRFDEALRDHDRAIQSAPELASLYINRSNTYTRAQRLDEAKADLDRAIELASRPPAPEMAPVEEGTAAAAGADPLAAPVMAPPPIPTPDPASQLGAAHYNRALIAQRRGDLEAALADARRAVGFAPDRQAYRRYVTELEALRAAGTAAPQRAPVPPSTN
jgi:tetratricopeptide (TPR) repeat protein